jgi:hypothetical protein
LLFILGFIYSNFIEVIAHRFFLHGLGKKKKSIFAFHWHTHHRTSRLNNMIDPEYAQSWFSKNRLFEVAALAILMSVNTLIFWKLPFFLIGILTYLVAYYNIHKYCHVYPEFAKKWFKGHYYHHMGKNQDLNWGTPIPLADWVMGTIPL